MWIVGILLTIFGPYQDNKVIGRLLILLGVCGIALENALVGNIILAFMLVVVSVINFLDLKKEEIRQSLSWHYALKMTLRRLVGDL